MHLPQTIQSQMNGYHQQNGTANRMNGTMNNSNQNFQINRQAPNGSVYQKPPVPLNYLMQNKAQQPQMNGNGSKSPIQNFNDHSNYNRVQQKSPQMMQQQIPSPYQRVPMPHPTQEFIQSQQQINLSNLNQPQNRSPYMLHPSKIATKKVSFEPGTKGGHDVTSISSSLSSSSTSSINSIEQQIHQQQQQQQLQNQQQQQNNPQFSNGSGGPTAIPTRVAISTYNNNAIVKASAKAVQCNLCRKKHVIAPAVYCADCDFYMSRFQPRR
jgi:hypothetical protein